MSAATPLSTVTPLQLAQMWTHDEARVICARPRDLEDFPDLALRIRGAFGRRLAEMGPPIAHRHDPFARPRAFDLLFGAGDPRGGRPMALDVDVSGDLVIVDLRLFGSAGFWIDQCRDALVQALAGGVSIRAESRVRVVFEPLEALGRRVTPDLPPAQVGGVTMRFLSPTAVRSGQSLLTAPSAYLFATVTRLRELAPWFGAELSADFRALRATCTAATITKDDLTRYRATRFSQRQRDREIPVTGVLGAFTATGALSDLAPFLTLAAFTHIGSPSARGMGRVDTVLWP